MRPLLLSFALLFFTQVAKAQITITSITLNGNLKTQNDIILRELSFEENKSYSHNDLTKRMEEAGLMTQNQFFITFTMLI